MFQSLSYLLLASQSKMISPFFAFMLILREDIKLYPVDELSRKEVGSSDSLLGFKNRPRRKRFFSVIHTLMLVCHYASCVDLGSVMTMFRDQTWPYWGVNTGAPAHTAKTAVLIIHRSGRILTQCNSFDGKHVSTQVKSIVSISHFHTPCSTGRRHWDRGGGERHSFVLET